MAKLALVRDQYYEVARIVPTQQWDVEDMRGFSKGRDKVLVSAYNPNMHEVLAAHKNFRDYHPYDNSGMPRQGKNLFRTNAFEFVKKMDTFWHAKRNAA